MVRGYPGLGAPLSQERGISMSLRKKLLGVIVLLVTAVIGAPLAMAKPARDLNSSLSRTDRQIRHEIVMLPYYSVFDNIAFKLEDGRLTLLGQVTRPTLRSDVERAVKGVEGVESVDNKIEVLPLSPFDDRIRRAVYRAIYGDATLFRYGLQAVPPIHIIVKNGNVALEGVVSTESEKNVAKIRANGVSGVFSVTNNLQVERSDNSR